MDKKSSPAKECGLHLSPSDLETKPISTRPLSDHCPTRTLFLYDKRNPKTRKEKEKGASQVKRKGG